MDLVGLHTVHKSSEIEPNFKLLLHTEILRLTAELSPEYQAKLTAALETIDPPVQ
jgi:hypothetical protein